VDYFCEHIYPQIKDIDTNMIVNVSGSSPEDYAECAARIDALEKIPAIELNISCPNVKDGGMAFGVTCTGAESVVRAVRERYHKTLIVKLSPNVTNIADIARACEAQGADSVSLINTLMGMAIDIEKRKSLLSIGTGGLSGPCVKPVALRMVWQVAKAVKIPVVGLGGISCATDAIEFLMAGATAIEIGTANFLDPAITIKVRDGISQWLDAHGCQDIHEIIGCI
jgi:dihydroorotate dehydrogenase (NAD+) catalytic subunit